MSLTVSEIDDGLYRVRWCTEPGPRMRKGDTFRLACAHPSESFVVSCVRDVVQRSPKPPDRVPGRRSLPVCRGFGAHHLRSTQLRLQVVDTRPGSANSAAEDERPAKTVDPFAYNLSSVWTRAVNGDRKLYLTKQQTPPGTWTLGSRKIDVDEQWEEDESRWLFRIKLWIKFERASPAKNALRQLLAAFDAQRCCDARFQLATGEQVGAHQVILLARSGAFAAMIRGKSAESGLVKVDDVDPEIFKHLLHYVYSTEHKEPLTVPKARQLLIAADKFEMSDLKEECTNFLLSHIGLDNALDLLTWAGEHSAAKLQDACCVFVVRNGYDVVMQQGFEDLAKSHPDLCIRLTREILKKKVEHEPSQAVAAPVEEKEEEMDESDTSESPTETDSTFNYF